MLTVLMATYNGAATLPRVLAAYRALQAPPRGWQLLVIDNGSSDATPQILADHAGRLPLRVHYEPRRGKNVALNAGLRLLMRDSASDLLVFSDDDAAPEPDWLLRLDEAARTQPDYAVFGGAIVADWGAPPPDWLLRLVPLGLTYAITSPDLPAGPVFPGLVWGANLAIRRSVFEAGYRFDEQVGPNGAAYAMGSETELTRRLFEAGYHSWFCPAARVAHHIRPQQLSPAYVLGRAWRFGRGQYRQAEPGKFPQLAGLPRWMWRRFAIELGGLLRSLLKGQRDQQLLHRWELAYLRGYLHEAWHGPRRGGKMVLITSYSGQLGGMELRMAQEARFLNQAGYHSALATRRFAGFDNWALRLRADGISATAFDPPLFFEQWSWRRLNLWRTQLFGPLRLRRFRADLVHVAFCWTHYGASALWLAQRCRLPAVISVHNAFPPAPISRWHQPLLRQAFKAVRGIYAVSDSAMAHFLALYRPYITPSTRLAVIPNCVDTERFRPSPARRMAARQQLGLAPDELVIGSVGRLAVQKQPEVLIRLLARLREEGTAVRLVLVGTGPLEASLRAQAAQAGLTPYVVFAGFQAAVEEIMPAFDLHLLMSRNEGFGIATIEAMACGVPAAGSDVPGTSDILRSSNGGLLLPAAEEGAAAALLAALLADPARRLRMAASAREEVCARYDSALVGAQVRAFYRGLL